MFALTALPYDIHPAQALRERASRAAANVLIRHWDEEYYPVDPFAIARRMGIKVLLGDLPDDISGMIRQDDTGQVLMYIDTDESPRRQRFTAAHELGHYAERASSGQLDEPFVDRRGDLATRGTSPSEIFANEFAASLLMPSALVRRLYRHNGLRAWELAKFFEVSPQAAEIRLQNLGLNG